MSPRSPDASEAVPTERLLADLPAERTVDPDELANDVLYQIGALEAFARAAGTRVGYVKPHGALYNATVRHHRQAAAVVAGIRAFAPLPVLGLPGSELLAEAETIDPKADLQAAQQHLHRIQQRWDEIGKVPRERMRELEGRLRTVADRVRTASETQWRRTDPEAQARVEQFRERVEQFEAQAEKARAAGDAKRAKQADEQAEQWRVWLSAAEQALEDR